MDIENKSYKSFEFNYLIDYKKISEAIDFYKNKGFSHIEVPWDTSEKYRNITFNGEDFNPIGENRYLVGSAEQSFAMLYHLEKIVRGSYVACTPCFRGDEIDKYHQEYFMKVELFDNNDTSEKRLLHIINLARVFFEQYISVKIVKVGDFEYDIMTHFDLELGSYGIRQHGNLKWIYGTGIAEPRLSKALITLN